MRCRSGSFMPSSAACTTRSGEWSGSPSSSRHYVPGADIDRSRRAVQLAKADLSTGMVGEFPELQGIMGRYYALHDGEDPAVADAIAEHYRPAGPSDACPTAPDSIVAALADKIDSLVAFFAIGEKPTGSRDPFALRRAALGIIRLILENGLRLPLAAGFRTRIFDAWGRMFADPTGELLDFIAERLRVHLREQGIGHDLIAAVFAQARRARGRSRPPAGAGRGAARLSRLGGWRQSADRLSPRLEYRRDRGAQDGRSYDGESIRTLLRQPEERVLADRLAEVDDAGGNFPANAKSSRRRCPNWRGCGARLTISSTRSPSIATTPELRENRLRLLSRIRATLNRVADFSQIEG